MNDHQVQKFMGEVEARLDGLAADIRRIEERDGRRSNLDLFIGEMRARMDGLASDISELKAQMPPGRSLNDKLLIGLLLTGIGTAAGAAGGAGAGWLKLLGS